jgi:hypothetical protein
VKLALDLLKSLVFPLAPGMGAGVLGHSKRIAKDRAEDEQSREGIFHGDSQVEALQRSLRFQFPNFQYKRADWFQNGFTLAIQRFLPLKRHVRRFAGKLKCHVENPSGLIHVLKPLDKK